MLKLKTVSLLKHRRELDSLPEGKLLINTINAHSYNTALKDPAFAEALLKGDALIPDGASIVLAFRLLRNEKIERIAGWDLFLHEMNKLNRKGGTCFFLGSSDDTLRKIKVTAGSALDWHDRTQAREMGLCTFKGIGSERTCRDHWSRIRFLCREYRASSFVVAGARTGMAIQADKGTQKNVEEIYHRQQPVLMEYC